MKTIILALMGSAIICCTNAGAQSWKLNGNNLTGTELLGSRNAFDLKFYTSNLQRMTIKADGRIGIGTTTPSAFLHTFGTVQIENNSSTLYDEPLLTLRTNNAGTPTNPVIAFRGQDTLYAVMGYDFSTRDMVFSTQSAGYSPDLIINHDNGFTGLNTKTPQERLHVIGNQILDGDLTLAATQGKGDINFTTDQQNIAFANPGAAPSSMIYMFGSPTSNKRMVLSHSTAFSNWGLQYNDSNDQFDFLGSGSSKFAVNLQNGKIGIGNTTPVYTLDVTGSSRFLGNVGIQTAPTAKTLQVGNTQGAVLGIGTAEYIQDAGTNILSTSATWTGSSDAIYALGTSAFRWASLWAVDGTINTSDARDKTNIRDMDYGLKEIMKLRGVKYAWKSNPAEGDKLGVIAQEIQKVLPEVVRDWEYAIDEKTGKATKVPSARLGVMYADIIPVLIKGMQEQQQQIEELKQLVSQLSQPQLQNAATVVNSSVAGNISLAQNTPNPFNKTTSIRYNLAPCYKNAQVIVTDNAGRILKQVLLNASGSVNIDGSTLVSGIYNYTLMVDGKLYDTKKMVLAK